MRTPNNPASTDNDENQYRAVGVRRRSGTSRRPLRSCRLHGVDHSHDFPSKCGPRKSSRTLTRGFPPPFVAQEGCGQLAKHARQGADVPGLDAVDAVAGTAEIGKARVRRAEHGQPMAQRLEIDLPESLDERRHAEKRGRGVEAIQLRLRDSRDQLHAGYLAGEGLDAGLDHAAHQREPGLPGPNCAARHACRRWCSPFRWIPSLRRGHGTRLLSVALETGAGRSSP